MIAIGRLQDTLLALKEEAMPLTWTSVSSAGVARGRILLNLLPPSRDQGGLGGEQGGRSSEGQEEWADNASITEPIPLGSYATKGKNAFSTHEAL